MSDQAGSSSAAVGAAGTAELLAGGGGTPAPAAAPGVGWLPQDAPADLRGFVENKGWKTPVDALTSYVNLEKLIGADRAGRTVVLPGDNADPKEVAAFYDRLGRPADPKDYKLEIPPEYGDPAFAENAGKWFHAEGLTAKQAQAVTKQYNAYVKEQLDGIKAEQSRQFQSDNDALKTEWGDAHDQNLVLARNVVRGLGLDNAAIDKLQQALGHAGVMKLLVSIGAKTGEGEFVTGATDTFKGALSPDGAKAAIKDLMNDKDFSKRYREGNVEARQRMEQLHKWAFPEKS